MAKKKKKGNGIVESFLGKMPMIGDFIEELAKTKTFQKRFKDIDEKIKENLRKDRKGKLGFEADISIRPLFNDVKKDTSEIAIEQDYVYGKKKDNMVLMVKVPKEDVKIVLKGKKLIITSDKFEKQIPLPDYFNRVKKKKYEREILVLELTK